MSKKRKQPKNWSTYNRAKINSGNIFLYLSGEIADWWYVTKEKNTKSGRPKRYSDKAIEFILMIRFLFRIPLRQTQGFMEGLINQIGLYLKVPSYTQLSRRSKKLKIHYRRQSFKEDLHVSVDSTGLKIHSGNQWNTYKHRKPDKRKWLKFHLAVDAITGEIIATSLTDSCTSDSSQLETLLAQVPDILEGFYGDGAYDRDQVYEAIKSHQDWPIDIVIPPIETLQVPDDQSIKLSRRQKHRLYLNNHGKDKWRSKFKYGRREKSEGSFARFKTIFGEDLLSRDNCAQMTEINIKCNYLNTVNQFYTEGFH